MLLLRSMLASVLLLVAALPAAAESLPELLKPVDPAVEAKLMARTNFDFRQQRYAAKRFRIVDINWALLSQEGARFTITPFEEPLYADLAVTVRTQALDREPRQGGQLRNWLGEIEESAWLAQGGPEGDLVSLWITSGPQQVTLKAARKVAVETGDTARHAMLPVPSDAPDALRITSKLIIRTISGGWSPLPGLEVELQPITDDPRYHFVYWVDRDTMPAGFHGGGGPDDAKKYQAMDEFNEQLDKERREAASINPE